MEVTPFYHSLAGEVTRAYNRAIEGVPHCYPVSPAELVDAVESTEAPDGADFLRAAWSFVVRLCDQIVGFATTAVAPPEEGDTGDRGLIRFLWYGRGHRRAGLVLLDSAETHLLAHGVRRIIAFDGDFRLSAYHLPHACLTDRMDHVHGLLGMRGFVRTRGEVFFDWPDFSPPAPGACPVRADIECEMRPGRGTRPGLFYTVRQGEMEVGFCVCTSGGEYSRHGAAQDWLFVEWLWIDEHLQGQGLGRYLLVRALNDARSAGYRHTAISTDASNHRAVLFYGNVGYQAVDWTSMYHKEANNEPA